MTPYEILLSESQERMLVVAEPEHVRDVQQIARKWELEATAVGHVTDDGVYRIRHGSRVVAEIPGQELVTGAPVVYAVGTEGHDAVARRLKQPVGPEPDPTESLHVMLDAPGLAGKQWVFEQYDSTVRAGTVDGPGGDAGVVVVPGTTIGIAATTDGNSRYVLLDPYEGGKATVAEAARNVACTGATPIGITNCLNFGSPERPEIFFQFREALRGIREACEVLETPVTGGNVSFYNESPAGGVDPTPVIGMIGMIDDTSLSVRPCFARSGDVIVLLGTSLGHLGGSAYWSHVRNVVGGSPPPVDLEAEKRLVRTLVGLASRKLVTSAHDLSDGGLALALTEACIGSPYGTSSFGARVDLRVMQHSLPPHAVLFGEDQARALVSTAPHKLDALLRLAREHAVPATHIGAVTDQDGRLEVTMSGYTLAGELRDLKAIHANAIARRFATMLPQPLEP